VCKQSHLCFAGDRLDGEDTEQTAASAHGLGTQAQRQQAQSSGRPLQAESGPATRRGEESRAQHYDSGEFEVGEPGKGPIKVPRYFGVCS